MTSYIRVYIDEDLNILKTVTLGPAVKEHIQTLSWSELNDFLDVFNDLISVVWARTGSFPDKIEGDDKK